MTEQTDAGHADAGQADVETTTVQLINHALQAMLNEHGAQGWELTGVEDDHAAHLQRPRAADERTVWRYATVPLVPAARQAIIDQWTEQGYELAVERDNVGYFKRTQEAAT